MCRKAALQASDQAADSRHSNGIALVVQEAHGFHTLKLSFWIARDLGPERAADLLYGVWSFS